MKDIDFDELDRAVGSVLGADSTADDSAKTDSPTTTVAPATKGPALMSAPAPATDEVSIADDSSSDSTTDPAHIKENENDIASSTPEIKPSVSPARKRGQFLDMVHPSADMRKAPKMPATTRKTVAPLSAPVVSGASEAKPSTDAIEAPTAFVPETPDVVSPREDTQSPLHADQETPKDEWPDPLDFAKESAEASVVAQEPVPASVPEVEPVGEASAPEAAQTPFVADAKVDKRPLDAFASQDGANDDIPPAEAPAHPAESDGDAPEFNPAVNSVESVGVPQAEDEATGLTGEVSITEVTTDEAAETSEPVGGSAPETDVKPEPATTVQGEAKPETPVEPAAPTQAASISQQYKVAVPPKDDSEAHPLFDTEEYHQPLLADGKKKTKKVVLIVVLLVVLLVIGGALGYIAFTVGI